MLQVREIMSKHVVTVQKDDTIRQAAKAMAHHRIGSLLVTEHQLPVGIVTESDFTRKAMAQDLPPQTPVKRIMTTPIYYSGPDADIIEVANSMRQNHIKKLPVIAGDQLLGVVTQTDIISHIFDSIKSLEAAYKQGNLTPQQYAQQSSELFHNFSSTLEGITKQWHMRCKDCGHRFLDPEHDGDLETQTCPQCGSGKIEYDQDPRI